MPKKKVGLLSKSDSIATLSYDDFDWDRFVAELKKQGLEVGQIENIPCG